jgi:hypothetical protein
MIPPLSEPRDAIHCSKNGHAMIEKKNPEGVAFEYEVLE